MSCVFQIVFIINVMSAMCAQYHGLTSHMLM